MRKVMMMLATAFLVSASGYAMADLCPIYLYGQWNGIYYYQCTPSGMCSTGTATPGQSSMLKQLGCDALNPKNCKDPSPIRPLVATVKGDGKDKKSFDVHITKTDGIKKKAKGRETGGPPGQSEDPEFDILLSPRAEFVKEVGGKKADYEVFVKAKDKSGNSKTFYFRVLELRVKDPHTPGIKIRSFVGQQLETSSTTDELKYAKSNGPFDHVLTNGDGDPFNVASFDEIQAP